MPEPPNFESGDRLAIALTMMQLGDSFFPSGLYTLSRGLEQLVAAGRVRGSEDLGPFLEDFLIDVIGPGEAVAAAASARAAAAADLATITEIDERLLAMKLAHEDALASRRTGTHLARLAREVFSGNATLEAYAARVADGGTPGNYAVTVGVVASALGASPLEAALVELYSSMTGLLGAALRLLRFDHRQAQGWLERLKPTIAATARRAAVTPPQEMRSFAPVIEIMQMQHERSVVRLFVS